MAFSGSAATALITSGDWSTERSSFRPSTLLILVVLSRLPLTSCLAVGRVGHGGDPIAVQLDGFYRRLFIHGNQVNGAVGAADRDGLAVGSEVSFEECVGAQRGGTDCRVAIGGIEENDAAELLGRTAGGGEPLAIGAEFDMVDQVEIRRQTARRGVVVDIEHRYFAPAGGGGEFAIRADRHARDSGGVGVDFAESRPVAHRTSAGRRSSRLARPSRCKILTLARESGASFCGISGASPVIWSMSRLSSGVAGDEERTGLAALEQRGDVIQPQPAFGFLLTVAADAMALEDRPDFALKAHVFRAGARPRAGGGEGAHDR